MQSQNTQEMFYETKWGEGVGEEGRRSEGVVKLSHGEGLVQDCKANTFVAPVSRVRMCCLWARQGVGHGDVAHQETGLKTGQTPQETARFHARSHG